MSSQPVVPQRILGDPAQAAMFLVVTVKQGHEAAARNALTSVSSWLRTVAFRVPSADVTCVVGIGSDFWDRAYDPAHKPSELHPFVELHGATHTAPSTPGDLLFHIRAHRTDLVFELAHLIVNGFGDAIEIEDEVSAFRYFDSRDLLGFVDGTENPTGQQAVPFVLSSQQDTFPASSYVIVQKYVHDLKAWNALTIDAQQEVIGRTKASDVEFPDDEKASNSHLVLNTVDDAQGRQRKIVRDNLPFGSLSEGDLGTYFIGYAADPDTTEEMLRRMFIGVPEGNHDRILDFSTARTGTLFFVPSADALDDPSLLDPQGRGATAEDDPVPDGTVEHPVQPASPSATPEPVAGRGAEDSLGLGDLRTT